MRGNFIVIAAALGTAAWLAPGQPASAGSTGECVAARVPAPFRLPDGVLHPAGVLTLCDAGAFSPVAGLHVLLVDGRSVGVFVSRKRAAEGAAGLAGQVVFDRSAAGDLDLVGYILPSAGRMTAYRLRGPSETRLADRRAAGATPAPGEMTLAVNAR